LARAKSAGAKLCEQAVVEQDTDRLLELIREINALLDAKKARLAAPEKERELGQPD
jgi:hypothetical protein